MKTYPTDLDDCQKELLKQTEAYKNWRSRKYEFFDVINAIIYIVVGGIKWKMLPKEYPNTKTVYYYYKCFLERGDWEKIESFAVSETRKALGQSPEPTLGIIDSQSVRSANPKSIKGIDGNKKVKGVKHTDIVDKNGFVLADSTTSAKRHDSKLAYAALAILGVRYPGIRKLLADNAYKGKLIEYAKEFFDIDVEIKNSYYEGVGFRPIEKRWIVERTYAWFDNYRRLCRNYETTLKSSHAMVMIASTLICLKRYSQTVQAAKNI